MTAGVELTTLEALKQPAGVGSVLSSTSCCLTRGGERALFDFLPVAPTADYK